MIAQSDFPLQGPSGISAGAALADLARSIVDEPEFRWKIWTENPDAGEAGGICLFDDEAVARAYIDEHTTRLADFGIRDIRAKVFQVRDGRSTITGAHVT